MKQISQRKSDRSTRILLDREDEQAENEFYWNYTEKELRNELTAVRSFARLSDESSDYLET